jgi:hypothetical protein
MKMDEAALSDSTQCKITEHKWRLEQLVPTVRYSPGFSALSITHVRARLCPRQITRCTTPLVPSSAVMSTCHTLLTGPLHPAHRHRTSAAAQCTGLQPSSSLSFMHHKIIRSDAGTTSPSTTSQSPHYTSASTLSTVLHSSRLLSSELTSSQAPLA